MKKSLKSVICGICASAILFSAGCGEEYKEKEVYAEELTANMKVAVEERALTDEFKLAYSGFSVEFFKRSLEKDNSLISPLSAAICLSMAFNGANGETLSEFENVFGGIEIAELNGYFRKIISSAGEKLKIADSIWLNAEKQSAEDEFLKAVKSYYDSEVYKAKFDGKLVSDMNNWVANKTNGMIDKIIDDTSPEFYMYLMNALYFASRWETAYDGGDVKKAKFTNANGEVKSVDMMYSTESAYFDYLGGQGFIKYYEGYDYAFMAILPKEGESVRSFAEKMDGNGFKQAIRVAENAIVHAGVPKFSYDYSLQMKDLLVDMGIEKAFNRYEADFTKIKKDGFLWIDYVLQKTKIELDETGTKAAAVTIIGMKDAAAAMPPEKEVTITLDRPFIYSIISVRDGLPIFMGSVGEL
ncbi:MAG: serpin family protein [Clostridia bacterium]|nr:serpin family protein [Clostridia bacterium]